MGNEFAFMDEVEQVDVSPDFGDDRRGLSPMLQELERVIGLEATLELVDEWGGTRLYIPHTAEDGQIIVQKVGLEAAAKLSGYCGGESLELPLASKYKSLKRDHQIFQLKKSGERVTKIARKFGITRRHVYEIVARETNRIAVRKYEKSTGRA